MFVRSIISKTNDWKLIGKRTDMTRSTRSIIIGVAYVIGVAMCSQSHAAPIYGSKAACIAAKAGHCKYRRVDGRRRWSWDKSALQMARTVIKRKRPERKQRIVVRHPATETVNFPDVKPPPPKTDGEPIIIATINDRFVFKIADDDSFASRVDIFAGDVIQASTMSAAPIVVRHDYGRTFLMMLAIGAVLVVMILLTQDVVRSVPRQRKFSLKKAY